MPGNFSTNSYLQLLDQLNTAAEWMCSLGVRIQNSRVQHYQCLLERLIDVYESRDEAKASQQGADFLNALYEVHELILIHEGLANFDDVKYLQRKLSLVVKGPLSHAQETTKSAANRARNVAFELILASRMRAAGLELNTNIGTDVAVDLDKRMVLFECKRPFSDSSLAENTRKAEKQLRKRFQRPGSTRTCGVIALDITKVVCPEGQILIRESMDDVGPWLDELLMSFIDEHFAMWNEIRSRKVIAVLVRIALQASSQSQHDGFSYCQHYGIAPFRAEGTLGYMLAASLGSVFERAIADRDICGQSKNS